MNDDHYKIEKLEKTEIKKMFKSGFQLFFRVPILSFFLAGFVMSTLALSYFSVGTGLMYFFPLLILPVISFHFCQSNDNNTPIWNFDWRYIKFVPIQYVAFVILMIILIFIGSGIDALFPASNKEEESVSQNSTWIAILAYTLIFVFVPALFSYLFARCNFNSLLCLYCANKWQLLNLNLKEDFKALMSFHAIVDEGFDKNHFLILFIGFFYFLFVSILCFLLSNHYMILISILSFSICIFHNILYVIVKHICKDGGINEKIKVKSFQRAESM